MPTIDELIRFRAGDHRTGLVFADRSLDPRPGGGGPRPSGPRSWPPSGRPGPFHVALLLDNVPEYVFWMGAAALAGAVLVGGNPTHRGDELARDLSHTECQLLVTTTDYRGPSSTGTTTSDRPCPRSGSWSSTNRRGDLRSAAHPIRASCSVPVAGAPLPDQATYRGLRGHRWASCCSPRGPRVRPRPASAARGAGPHRGSWHRCSSSPRTTSAIWPCRCSTPTP
jgi:hypothetical protein